MKRKMIGLCLTAMLVSMVVFSSSVEAVLVTYTDQASWEAALSGTATLENFESVTSDIDFGNSTGSAAGALTFNELVLNSRRDNDSSNADTFIDANAPASGRGINGNDTLAFREFDHEGSLSAIEYVEITLPANISAFAFLYRNYDTQNDGTTLSVDGSLISSFEANNTRYDLTAGNGAFFGVVEDGGGILTNVRFTAKQFGSAGSYTYNELDDVRYGVAAVPEPSAFAFMSLVSCLGMCVARYRKRSRLAKD